MSNRRFFRGRRRPSFPGGRRGRTVVPSFCLIVLMVWSSPLAGVEIDALTSVGEGALGKGLEKEHWDRNAPVDIHSDEMGVDFEGHQIVFKGNVKVRQSDFSLSAGEVTAVFGESADDIKKIIAEKNVRIRKGDREAWGDRAAYDRQNATIVLVGSAVLKQGRNFIRGQEIHFHLDDERMEVKGRVEAEFRLSDQQKGPVAGDQGAGTDDQKSSSGAGDSGSGAKAREIKTEER